MAVKFDDVKVQLDKPLLFSQGTQSAAKDFLLEPKELLSLAIGGDPGAQYILGRSYQDGWNGLQRNWGEGTKWLEAAKKHESSPAGMCAQGICYEKALCGVIITNLEKAKQCYSAAAKLDYIPGITQLAFTLMNESITTSTSSTATRTATHTHLDQEKLAEVVRMLTPCAEAGFPDAIYILASCFFHGHGVPKDQSQTRRLFHMAAEKGHAPSKKRLGIMYAFGFGGDHDSGQSRKWFAAAEAQGEDLSDAPKPYEANMYGEKSLCSSCIIL